MSERDLEGFKLLEPVSELLAALRDESDSNRTLHFDHYVTLLLFYFFTPVLTSLRGLQASTDFPKVRRKLGIPRARCDKVSETRVSVGRAARVRSRATWCCVREAA